MPKLERLKIAEFDTFVVIPDGTPKLCAVFNHGFGAPGDDLVPLAEELLRDQPALIESLALAFPQAPLSLTEYGIPGGRAWWMLDMEKLQRAIESGEFRNLRSESPPELPALRNRYQQFLSDLSEQFSLAPARMILGGFSQGSMLATDVALHADLPVGGLVVWSGTLLNEKVWRGQQSQLKSLPILQSHGHQDPILPYQAAEWLRDFFAEAGAENTFLDFTGGHTIPFEVLEATKQFLAEQLN